MKPFEMTEEFHHIFDPRKPQHPTAFSAEEAGHRAAFKIEELVEFLYAASRNDSQVFNDGVAALHQAIDHGQAKIVAKGKPSEDSLVEQVDALTDLLYLTYGSFSLLGVDPEPIMAIVHEANMAKLFPDGKPHYDPETNKVLKPADWGEKHAPEARIRKAIEQQKKWSENE
ncbi:MULTISPECIES: pyrophosphohydrolase domain-containing protein [Enterococcus]|uniref:HAD family hydrolase n=1 Tax=Enterococcus TaxID=1350 RepID=UPI000A64C68A|nr:MULTISPECIES: HAD family hydrolase [Enterococcus]